MLKEILLVMIILEQFFTLNYLERHDFDQKIKSDIARSEVDCESVWLDWICTLICRIG